MYLFFRGKRRMKLNKDFDNLLAYHCGPTLAGIKPGNLLSISLNKNPDYIQVVDLYKKRFAHKKIHFEILCECGGRVLLFIYRVDKLHPHLLKPENKTILLNAGYPDCINLSSLVTHLKTRMQNQDDFPHEIGVFLGYPPEDVHGYCKNCGKHSLYSGYWKVYDNVEEKVKLFGQYDKCCAAISKRIAAGWSISDLFAAV